jgi:hypothetical protein
VALLRRERGCNSHKQPIARRGMLTAYDLLGHRELLNGLQAVGFRLRIDA